MATVTDVPLSDPAASGADPGGGRQVGPVVPTATTQRVARVLLGLDGAGDWIGVSAIARNTGLGKAAAHRILRGLQPSGLVAYDPDRRLYRLGPAAVALGQNIDPVGGPARSAP